MALKFELERTVSSLLDTYKKIRELSRTGTKGAMIKILMSEVHLEQDRISLFLHICEVLNCAQYYFVQKNKLCFVKV